ncbi:MAG TPA: DUF2306 domain-containing protein [Acidobacteriaceae bacterium]|nr:DUF2306 domain-containing protein [Acidobacteriaceae bacterium]
MAAPTTTLPPAPPAPARRRFTSKHTLWLFMGLAALFVFITTELFLAFNYAPYHPYRLQLIHDRALLIPHAIAGTLAFVAGPIQFSSRLRARHLQFHRILGRVYVFSVFTAATFGFLIELSGGHRPDFPGVIVQISLWVLCTLAAFITARNRQIAVHRQWMIRSYALTFTFILNRLLNLWPTYFNLSPTQFAWWDAYVCIIVLLGCDIAFNSRELTHRRA